MAIVLLSLIPRTLTFFVPFHNANFPTMSSIVSNSSANVTFSTPLLHINILYQSINRLLNNTINMVREAKGKIVPIGGGNTRYVSIPSNVVMDSSFPFEDKESVNVRIDGKRLIIEKAKE